MLIGIYDAAMLPYQAHELKSFYSRAGISGYDSAEVLIEVWKIVVAQASSSHVDGSRRGSGHVLMN